MSFIAPHDIGPAGDACAVPAVNPPGRTWVGPSASERLAILRRTKVIAIVGASANPARASYFVATYLLSSSPFEVYFVNPRATEILGHPVYPSLAALPVVPDLVDVFRRHDDLPTVLEETLAVGARTLWLQLGSWHEEVARLGAAAGLEVVMDRCVKIEPGQVQRRAAPGRVRHRGDHLTPVPALTR